MPDPADGTESDPAKEKLEYEKLTLEVRKLRETVELEKKMLDKQLDEMQIAPKRTVRLSLVTTAASILTTFAIGILGFQINVAAALQRDNDTYHQMFQSIDADRPGVRASAALGLGSAFQKPSVFFSALSPPNPDRSRQSLVMLAERLKVEIDPVVQLSIFDALNRAPASVDSAETLLNTSEYLSRKLQRALVWSARLNKQLNRTNDVDQHYIDLLGDADSLDIPGSASLRNRMLVEWSVFSSRTLHEHHAEIIPTRLPLRNVSAETKRADTAVKTLAIQRLLVGQIVTRMINENPALIGQSSKRTSPMTRCSAYASMAWLRRRLAGRMSSLMGLRSVRTSTAQTSADRT